MDQINSYYHPNGSENVEDIYFTDDEDNEEEITESEYSITDDERKRQNHINEFIATEKAYVRDMEIVIDVSHRHHSEGLS